MARHRHPHVLLFMGVCTRPPNLAIVTEFCDNGSLHDVLKAKRDTPEDLLWARRLAFAADAARGLNYLHTSRPATIHADLNTSNLLVDRSWRVKVADFGLSRLLQNAPRGVIQGTNVSNKNASHLAPEVLRSEPYGTPSDVFSFGCVLWALATLRCGRAQEGAARRRGPHPRTPSLRCPSHLCTC
jgi:serine/threonine protein kinase